MILLIYSGGEFMYFDTHCHLNSEELFENHDLFIHESAGSAYPSRSFYFRSIEEEAFKFSDFLEAGIIDSYNIFSR